MRRALKIAGRLFAVPPPPSYVHTVYLCIFIYLYRYRTCSVLNVIENLHHVTIVNIWFGYRLGLINMKIINLSYTNILKKRHLNNLNGNNFDRPYTCLILEKIEPCLCVDVVGKGVYRIYQIVQL